MKPVARWAVLVHGEHLHFEECVPSLFLTRREARDFIEAKYGYIRNRPDLRAPPHSWRMPKPVRVRISEAKS